MPNQFKDREEARKEAIAFASVKFVRTFTEMYDKLIEADQFTDEEILQHFGLAKCVALLNAEGYRPAQDHPKLMRKVRKH